jgi:hypothetical protein
MLGSYSGNQSALGTSFPLVLGHEGVVWSRGGVAEGEGGSHPNSVELDN